MSFLTKLMLAMGTRGPTQRQGGQQVNKQTQERASRETHQQAKADKSSEEHRPRNKSEVSKSATKQPAIQTGIPTRSHLAGVGSKQQGSRLRNR